MTTLPKCQILIASYSRDFPWLTGCLRSLEKFARKFLPPVIAVPYRDLTEARRVVGTSGEVFVFDVPAPFQEASQGLGAMRAQDAMMHADLLCPRAEIVFLLGSDCLATRPFTPWDYLDELARPMVLHNSYAHLAAHHPAACEWRDGTAQAVGFDVHLEYMRRLPSVFRADTYRGARSWLERLHGRPFRSWWYESFLAGQTKKSEANILGAFADMFQTDAYDWLDLEHVARPPQPILQLWSHGGMEHPIDVHYQLPSGDVFGRCPRDVTIEILTKL